MLRSCFCTATAFLLLAAPAMSAEPHRLAFSKKLGAEVFALPDGTDKWCRSELSLTITLDDASPLLTEGVASFVSKLGPIFAQECSDAVTATVQSYTAKNREPIGSTYIVRKEDGWLAHPMDQAQSSATQDMPPSSQTVKPDVRPDVPASKQADDMTAWGLVLAYAKFNPQILTEENTVKNFAASFDCEDFQRMFVNEFKLSEYLTKVKEAMQSKAASQKPYFRLAFTSEFGNYDEKHGAFDFEPLSAERYFDAPSEYCYQAGRFDMPINRFSLAWKPEKTLYRLPMSREDAESLVNKISKSTWKSREVYVEVIANPHFTDATADGVVRVDLEILEATVYDSKKSGKRLHTYSTVELIAGTKEVAAIRAVEQEAALLAEETRLQVEAEGERQIALTRQRQQAEQDIQWLESAPLSYRIAYLAGSKGLDTTNMVLGRSLVAGAPSPATFLVQAANNGTSNIEAAWPKRLTMNVAAGSPPMEKGRWYVVSGDVTAKRQSDGLPPLGLMDVKFLAACEQDKCAEADNPLSLIHRRYPGVDLQVIGN